MTRKRYTFHNGKMVDITDDPRPTAWQPLKDFPIRIVKCWQKELLIYIQSLLSGYFATMRYSGELAKYYQAAMQIDAIISEVLEEDND